MATVVILWCIARKYSHLPYAKQAWLAFLLALLLRLGWRIWLMTGTLTSTPEKAPEWVGTLMLYVVPVLIDSGLLGGAILFICYDRYVQGWHFEVAIPQPARVSINAESRILEWDSEAESMFGYTASEAIGRLVTELIIPEDLRQRHLDGIARFLLSQDDTTLRQSYHVDAVNRGGERFEVKVELAVIRAPEGVKFTSKIWHTRYAIQTLGVGQPVMVKT